MVPPRTTLRYAVRLWRRVESIDREGPLVGTPKGANLQATGDRERDCPDFG